MAPNTTEERCLEPTEGDFEKLIAPQAAPRKFQIVYRNILTFGYGHIAALYGLYLALTQAMWKTIFF
ncbi:unnamed protein product [Pieris macdunnoughi]|uniref:Uncharacterized protein n=1 Tax=Pieris macdunnoughi TaxID=345717 RepID=A0A821NEU6_9NEOP|nr:unnamed protein product [Pieris macdunnoughi]